MKLQRTPQTSTLLQLAAAVLTLVAFFGLLVPGTLAQNTMTCGLDSWVGRNSQVNVWLHDVAFGPSGGFVGVGDLGVIVSSPDGEHWTSSYQSTTVGFSRVRFVNGQYVVVGRVSGTSVDGYSGLLWTSPDGRAWTPRYSATNSVVFGVAAGNGRLVAVANETPPGGIANARSLVSTDGVTWSPTGTISTGWMYDIAFGNGLFVAVGGSRIMTSDLGVNWAAAVGPGGQAYQAVTFFQGRFIIVGEAGTILTSIDGRAWTPGVSGTQSYLAAIAGGGGQFVAAGNDGTILTSQNGTDWVPRLGSGPHFRGLAYGADRFVAVGLYGTTYQSGQVSGCGGPRLAITAGAQIRLDLSGTIGVHHRIEYADQLGGEWKLLEDVANLPGSPYGVIDPVPSPTGLRIYRAIELP